MSTLVMVDPTVETDTDADLDNFFLGRLATLVAAGGDEQPSSG
ncbi:MAG: hypothetical protein U0841_19915 [Chloroflexia bacterium]